MKKTFPIEALAIALLVCLIASWAYWLFAPMSEPVEFGLAEVLLIFIADDEEEGRNYCIASEFRTVQLPLGHNQELEGFPALITELF